MSRDRMGQCCGDPGSLSLAESTYTTGKRAGISFQNAGQDEGNLVLAGNADGTGRGRRIVVYDNQGQGMRLEADDLYIRSVGKWASQMLSGGIIQYDIPQQQTWDLGWHAGCFAAGASGWPQGGYQQVWASGQSGSLYHWYGRNIISGNGDPDFWVTCIG